MQKHHISRLPAMLLVLVLLCTGCDTMLDRSYLYVVQHDELYQEDLETDSLTVDSYYGLRNAILSFVESGTEQGVIRCYSYDGDDIEADLEQAAYEVTRSDPLGAWAVDYMTHDCNRIVSYYEITISITFRRTAEEIAALEQVSSMSAARTRLVQAVEDCETELAMRLSYTSELDAEEELEQACLENPLLRLGNPSVSMSIYPDSGVQRILELSFSWEKSAAAVTTMREQAQEALDTLSRFVSDTASEESRMSIYFRRLCNRSGYDPESEEDDIYAALVSCASGSRGIAEAFSLLCTQNGLDCSIISGRKNGELYWWNQVTLDGQVYHVDVAAAMEAGSRVMTLLYDEDLYATYSWDTSLYPASTRPAEEETEEETEEIEETELEEALEEETGEQTQTTEAAEEPAAQQTQSGTQTAGTTAAQTEEQEEQTGQTAAAGEAAGETSADTEESGQETAQTEEPEEQTGQTAQEPAAEEDSAGTEQTTEQAEDTLPTEEEAAGQTGEDTDTGADTEQAA